MNSDIRSADRPQYSIGRKEKSSTESDPMSVRDYEEPSKNVSGVDGILGSRRVNMWDGIGDDELPNNDDMKVGSLNSSKNFKERFGQYLNEPKEADEVDPLKSKEINSEEESESLNSYDEFENHEIEDGVILLDFTDKVFEKEEKLANEIGSEVTFASSDQEEKHNIDVTFPNSTSSPTSESTIKMGVGKDPDNISHVEIHLDMDLRKKNAEYILDIPDFCVKRIQNKQEYKASYHAKEQQEKTKKLNIEITLIIPDDNYEDSDVQVTINSKKKNVNLELLDEEDYEQEDSDGCDDVVQQVELAQFKERRATLESINNQTKSDAKGDVHRHDFRYKLPNVELPLFKRKKSSLEADAGRLAQETNKRFDFRYKLPTIELPSFGTKRGQDLDSNPESSTKRYDFRYQLPKIELRLLRNRSHSADSIEVSKIQEVKIDPQLSYLAGDLPDRQKRFDFRYKLPKIEFPAFRTQGTSGNIEHDLPEEEGNLTKRFDFRYKLPKVDFPLCTSKDKSEEEDVTKGEVIIEHPSKRYDFRYQVPKVDLPLCSSKEKSDTEDSDHEATLDASNKRFDFRYQLPKVEMPLCGSKDKSGENDTETEDVYERPKERYKGPKIDLTLCHSKNETNDDEEEGAKTPETPKRYDFRYQLPKIDLPLCGSKDKSDEDVSEAEAPVDNPNQRFDFRYQLPKIDLPLCGNKDKSDEDVAEAEAPVDNPNQRFDFRYQLPKVEMPLCGNKEKSDLDEEEEEDHTLEDSPKRYDFRYKLPKVELPLCNKNEKSEDEETEYISPTLKSQSPTIEVPIIRVNKDFEESAPDVNTNEFDDVGLQSSANESYESIETPKRFDFRYQLPKIEVPLFSIKDSKNTSAETFDDVKLESSDDGSRRYDFRYQIPKIELPLFTKKPSDEEAQDDDLPKRFDFRYQLPKIESPLFRSSGKSASNEHASYYASSPDPRSSDDDGIVRRSGSTHQPTSPNLLQKIFLNKQVKYSPYDKSADDLISDHSDFQSSTDSRPYLKGSPLKNSPIRNVLRYDDSSVWSGEEHSDIDLYPSPFRTIDLPGRSLLSRSLSYSAGSSDVDYPMTTKMRVTYHNLSILDQCSSLFNKTQDAAETPTLRFTDIKDDDHSCFSSPKVRSVYGSVPHRLSINKPTVFVGTHCLVEENCKFSIFFEGQTAVKINCFKVQHSDGLLTCCECYLGVWQQTMTCTALFETSIKELKMVILPTSDRDVVVLYNAEVMVEYNLKGSIENFERLTVDGDIKLSDE